MQRRHQFVATSTARSDHSTHEGAGAVVAKHVVAAPHVEVVDTGHAERLDGIGVGFVDDSADRDAHERIVRPELLRQRNVRQVVPGNRGEVLVEPVGLGGLDAVEVAVHEVPPDVSLADGFAAEHHRRS